MEHLFTYAKDFLYQLRNDLRLYEPRKFESTLIKNQLLPTRVIVAYINILHFPINDFTNYFISHLLLKLQKKSLKRIFLLGKFNIDF